MIDKKAGKPKDEELLDGIPHRLLDGYDGGRDPSDEEAAELLASAPEAVKARAKEWAAQRAELDAGDKAGKEQPKKAAPAAE